MCSCFPSYFCYVFIRGAMCFCIHFGLSCVQIQPSYFLLLCNFPYILIEQIFKPSVPVSLWQIVPDRVLPELCKSLSVMLRERFFGLNLLGTIFGNACLDFWILTNLSPCNYCIGFAEKLLDFFEL